MTKSFSFLRRSLNVLWSVLSLVLVLTITGCENKSGGQTAGVGDRRAGAVRERLISQGVEGNRIQTVSFGLELPADSGHNEAAWAKNRRAEIGVVR